MAYALAHGVETTLRLSGEGWHSESRTLRRSVSQDGGELGAVHSADEGASWYCDGRLLNRIEPGLEKEIESLISTEAANWIGSLALRIRIR